MDVGAPVVGVPVMVMVCSPTVASLVADTVNFTCVSASVAFTVCVLGLTVRPLSCVVAFSVTSSLKSLLRSTVTATSFYSPCLMVVARAGTLMSNVSFFGLPTMSLLGSVVPGP